MSRVVEPASTVLKADEKDSDAGLRKLIIPGSGLEKGEGCSVRRDWDEGTLLDPGWQEKSWFLRLHDTVYYAWEKQGV